MANSDFSNGTGAPLLRLALFEPDIPQNAGTIIRMAACFGCPVSIVGPAGFPVSDRAFRRAGMDYLDHAAIDRHVDFPAFDAWRRGLGARLVLATTRGGVPHVEAAFRPGDIVLFGRESVGAPDYIHETADLRLKIPMRPALRSLNVAVSAAILAGEALRQLGGFPHGGDGGP